MIAEKDHVITMKHSQRLIDAFPVSKVEVQTIENTGHNNILQDESYYHVLQTFLKRRNIHETQIYKSNTDNNTIDTSL